MFKHLVNKKLPFAIRIAGIDNGIRVTQQFPDDTLNRVLNDSCGF